METAAVYFPQWAKTKSVRITTETRAILRTLYRKDGVWYCCHQSASQALEPFIA